MCNLNEILDKNLSRSIIDDIVDKVIQSPYLFNEIYDLTKDKNSRVACRVL